MDNAHSGAMVPRLSMTKDAGVHANACIRLRHGNALARRHVIASINAELNEERDVIGGASRWRLRGHLRAEVPSAPHPNPQWWMLFRVGVWLIDSHCCRGNRSKVSLILQSITARESVTLQKTKKQKNKKRREKKKKNTWKEGRTMAEAYTNLKITSWEINTPNTCTINSVTSYFHPCKLAMMAPECLDWQSGVLQWILYLGFAHFILFIFFHPLAYWHQMKCWDQQPSHPDD